MRYFSIEYEYWTRPMYRKGRPKTVQVVFAATDQTEAYTLAQAEGVTRFSRRKWKVLGCVELTVAPN